MQYIVFSAMLYNDLCLICSTQKEITLTGTIISFLSEFNLKEASLNSKFRLVV